jgi:hypothetical protein
MKIFIYNIILLLNKLKRFHEIQQCSLAKNQKLSQQNGYSDLFMKGRRVVS